MKYRVVVNSDGLYVPQYQGYPFLPWRDFSYRDKFVSKDTAIQFIARQKVLIANRQTVVWQDED